MNQTIQSIQTIPAIQTTNPDPEARKEGARQ